MRMQRVSCCAGAFALMAAAGAQGQLINGSFETGDFTGWVTQDLASPFFMLQVGPSGITPGFGFFTSNPTDGTFAALHGWDGDGPAGPGPITIAQDLVLAPNIVEMQFDYRAAWDKTFGATAPREFFVEIEPFGGGPAMQQDLLLVADPNTMNPDTGDLTGLVDLSAFAGAAVRISFEWTVPEAFTGPAFFQLDNVQLVEAPFAERTLIIKQGACPAPFNPSSNGLTPVLLVGEADFDVNEVILSSLELARCDGMGGAVTPREGPPGPGSRVVDLNHPNDDDVGCDAGVPCACNDEQSSDGIDDLQMRFDSSEMAEVLLLDQEPGGSIVTLFLTGQLADGSLFTAADCVQVVGQPAAPGTVSVQSNVPGLWVDAAPPDVIRDDGGFTQFVRAYPPGSLVLLTAPPSFHGLPFEGWEVNSEPLPFAFPSPTIFLFVPDEPTEVLARYGPSNRSRRAPNTTE